MAKFVSIFLTAFFFHGFLFIPAIVNAEAFKLSSISVKGNNRLSAEADYQLLKANPKCDYIIRRLKYCLHQHS
jgi:cell division septal protein FtsQ